MISIYSFFFFGGPVSVSMSSYSIKFYIELQTRTSLVHSDQNCISLTFVFVFCYHKMQAVSLLTLFTASSFSSSSSSSSSSISFRIPTEGPPTFYRLLLPWNTDGSGLSHPGLHWFIALLCFTIASYLYFCKSWCLSLSITNYVCGLPSSRSPGWTGGHVAWAPLRDASSCSVISWIHPLYM